MNLSKLAAKTRAQPAAMLGADENPFSSNRVTGWSINFPITETCQPTKVCAETCYFARGPSTWTAALAKQVRLQNRLDADPDGLADQIVAWATKLRMTFIRWQGGGDMTRNSARCIGRVAAALPEVAQWVVTRRPVFAAQIAPRENVYVHISTDRSSLDRVREFEAMAHDGLQWFWSYQGDRGEVPPAGIAPIVFRDGYRPEPGDVVAEGDCPLNRLDDITGACGGCRMCFDGTAVKRAGQMHRP